MNGGMNMGRVQIPLLRHTMDTDINIHNTSQEYPGINMNGTIEKYRVSSGEIVEGQFVEFITNTNAISSNTFLIDPNYSVKATQIDRHNVLLTYIEPETRFGVAKIATIRLNSVTFSDPIIFSTTQIRDLSITKMNVYTYLISYIDTTTGFGNLSILRVLNGEVTITSTVVVSPALLSSINITSISEISALVAYYSATGFAQFAKVTISGTEISIGEPFVFNTSYTTGIELSIRDDKSAIAVTYADENNDIYVQQISIGPSWIPSERLFLSNRINTSAINPVIYASKSELIVGIDSSIHIIDEVDNVLSIKKSIDTNSSSTICDLCKFGDAICASVSNYNDIFDVYTFTKINDEYYFRSNPISTEPVYTDGVNFIKISEAMGFITYSIETASKVSLLSVNDVEAIPAESSFGSEGLSLDSGYTSDIITVDTMEDHLTTLVGDFQSNDNGEIIGIGDFVNRVDNYTLNEYGISEEQILHEMYIRPDGSEIDYYHYGLYGETSIVKIDENRILLVYARVPITLGQSSTVIDMSRPYVRICKITGTTVEFGNAINLNDKAPVIEGGSDFYGVRAVSTVVMSNNRILVVYGNGVMTQDDDDYGQNGGLWSALFDYNDITLTRLNPDRDTASKISVLDISADLLRINDTQLIVQFAKRALLVSIYGDKVTVTDPNIEFEKYYRSGGVGFIRYAVLDDERIVMVANHQEAVQGTGTIKNSLRLYIYSITDNGATVRLNETPYLILNDNRLVRSIGLAKLTNNRIAVAYAISDSRENPIHILNIADDNTVSELSSTVYHSGQMFFVELNALTPNKILLTHYDRNISTSAPPLKYRNVFVDDDGTVTLSEPLSYPNEESTMYTIALNEFKSISIFPRKHPNADGGITAYRQAKHLRLRVIGTGGDIPDFNVTELLNDNTKITRSNTTSDALGIVSKINTIVDEHGDIVNRAYSIYDIKPFLRRVKEQAIVTCKISELSETIEPGDFIQFTIINGDEIEIEKSTTRTDGIAIGYGNPSDLINVRTLYK